MDQNDYQALRDRLEEFLGNNWGELYPSGHPGHNQELGDDEIIERFVLNTSEQNTQQAVDDIRDFAAAPNETLPEKARFIRDHISTSTYIPSDSDQEPINWLDKQAKSLQDCLHRH